MLSDEQLEIISDTLAPLFNYLEAEVIADIARRIQKTMTYTRTAELQAMSMHKLGYSPAKIRSECMKLLNADPEYRKIVAKNTLKYKREVRNIINSITKEACKANDEIVAEAGNMSWVSDLSVWKEANKELTDNSFLQQLAESFAAQTAGELKNMTRTTGFKTMSGYEAVENAYKRELDKAVIKICSGTFSQDKVLRDVVHDLAQSGLRSIDFASGYSMQLDTAARVALRTGCHQLAAKITDKNIEQTGENLVYVSKHWGARNKGVGHANHEQWQGGVYYIKPGKDYREEAKRIGQDYIMDLWYSTGYSIDGAHENDPLGLNGYNCRHNHHPWFEGASTFPKEQPEPEPVTINGKTYDYYAMTQKMRRMESSVRALKREKEALRVLNMPTTEIDAKIKRKRAEYKDFCNACGVPEKTSKMRYECGTSNLKKTRAWKRYHTLVGETYSSPASNIESMLKNKRSPDELSKVAKNIHKELNYYTENKSKWSGKLIINNKICEKRRCSGAKEWNCDIILKDNVDDGIIWHEMLHSSSISNYGEEAYTKYYATEEAAVEFYTQEICKSKNIIHQNAYGHYITVLRTLNTTMKFFENDFEFAKVFYNTPVPERYSWLQNKVAGYLDDNSVSIKDASEIIDFIQILGDMEL